MVSTILTLLHVVQAAFSAYNLYLSSISISNLRNYEYPSERAAQYSKTAAHELHTTRTTQASGTGAILLTFLTAVSLVVYPMFSDTLPDFVAALAAGVNTLALMSARKHVGEFWERKGKVLLPGAGDYNEAIRNTQIVRLHMAYLAASWAVSGVLSLVL